MTHQMITDIALNSGLVYFVGLFAVVLGYVFWPKNRSKFDHAARLPLLDEEE